MSSTVRRIEINFPEPVELDNRQMQRLDAIAGELCKAWQEKHPGRVMWPFGTGFKITFMPMTREDEETRGIEFDQDTFEISCSERADYKWPCAKCGKEQGDHKDHILDPPAGDCEFAPKIREPAQ
jgi:hypothetical protein